MVLPSFGSLSEAQLAGQFLLVGIQATELDSGLKRELSRIGPGGIILFTRNVREADQLAALCRDLTASLRVPPLLAIDQEGGRVSRLDGIFPPIPSNWTLARAPHAESLVQAHARHTARALRTLGFNVNFAPVLDLSDPEMANGIGDRSYGTDPTRVADLGGLFLKSMEEEGILGCGKHFPGLGGGLVDSHRELPVIDLGGEELWERHLAPYRALRDRCPMVMVGHAFYPSIQEDSSGPATLSSRIVTQLLRQEIRYQGICLTDDLEMGAVDQALRPGEVALKAVEVGHDLVMFCHSWDRIEEAHATLHRALRTGRLPPARVERTLSRIFSLKSRIPLRAQTPPYDIGILTEATDGLAVLHRQVEEETFPTA